MNGPGNGEGSANGKPNKEPKTRNPNSEEHGFWSWRTGAIAAFLLALLAGGWFLTRLSADNPPLQVADTTTTPSAAPPPEMSAAPSEASPVVPSKAEPTQAVNAATSFRSLIGMPMVYELKGKAMNLVLEDLIKDSLKRDPQGNAFIKGTPCSTPRAFLDAIKRMHPEAQIDSVDQLPAFFHALIVRPARTSVKPGRYAMSWMKCGAPGSITGRDVLMTDDSSAREFRPEEMAFFHPNLDGPILAGDCKNVVGRLLDAPAAPKVAQVQCAALHIKTRPGTTIHVADIVRKGQRLPPDCWALKQGNGEKEAWPGRCDDCSWTKAVEAVSLGGEPEIRQPGKFVAEADEVTLYMPLAAVMNGIPAVCAEDANGNLVAYGVESSDWPPSYEYTLKARLG